MDRYFPRTTWRLFTLNDPKPALEEIGLQASDTTREMVKLSGNTYTHTHTHTHRLHTELAQDQVLAA
jgi:hypothetical protein